MSTSPTGARAPERLVRRPGTAAVVTGLGWMIGAGVFVGGAGPGLLRGLASAPVVAYCAAASSARPASRYPQSGGAYVYGVPVLPGGPAGSTRVAVAAVVALAVDYAGVRKAAWLIRMLSPGCSPSPQ